MIHGRFSFAHLSDLHVALHTPPPIRGLLNKRLLGFLAWRMHRRHRYRPEILDRLRTDLAQLKPDHVVITGDLTTLALPIEFKEAERQLYAFGGPSQVSLVPGNHDAYVPLQWGRSWAAWAEYMSSESAGSPPQAPTDFTDFPWVRRRSFVAFIGLSSAVPTRLFLAQGRLGAAQLDRLEHQLTRLAKEGLFRVILVHHSPIDETGRRRKRLTDAAELRAVIRRAGAELILHGHDHHSRTATVSGPNGPVPVLGVAPAAAMPRAGKADSGAQYHMLKVIDGEKDWEVSLVAHHYDAASHAFVGGSVRSFRIGRGFGGLPRGGAAAAAIPGPSCGTPAPQMSCQGTSAAVVTEN